MLPRLDHLMAGHASLTRRGGARRKRGSCALTGPEGPPDEEEEGDELLEVLDHVSLAPCLINPTNNKHSRYTMRGGGGGGHEGRTRT